MQSPRAPRRCPQQVTCLTTHLSSTSFPSLSHFPASLPVFSGILLNKSVALESLLQGLHLGEPKRRHIISLRLFQQPCLSLPCASLIPPSLTLAIMWPGQEVPGSREESDPILRVLNHLSGARAPGSPAMGCALILPSPFILDRPGKQVSTSWAGPQAAMSLHSLALWGSQR